MKRYIILTPVGNSWPYNEYIKKVKYERIWSIIDYCAVSCYIVAMLMLALMGENRSIRLWTFTTFMIVNGVVSCVFYRKKMYPYVALQIVGIITSIVGIVRNYE